jgi:hypothetical protein
MTVAHTAASFRARHVLQMKGADGRRSGTRPPAAGRSGPAWRGHNLDLLFIDGDHTDEAVRRDWDLFSSCVRPGGHVAFHDARADADGAGWPGPTAVVKTLFGSGGTEIRRWRVVAEQHRTVVVQKSRGDGSGGVVAGRVDDE